jgi:MFS family permease
MSAFSIRRTTRPGAAFALLGAVQVTLIATITLITVALPAIQRDLHLDGSGLILVGSAYGLSFGGLLLLGGRLGDLLGHRRVLLAGMAVFGSAAAVAGLAPGFVALLAARFVQGAGAALAAPAALALLGSVFPDPSRRARAMAVWGVLSSAGAAAGNVLSGVLSTWLPWRWVFLPPIAVTAVVAAAAPRLVPDGPPPVTGRVDWLGAVLATAGLAALIYGLQHSTWALVGGAVLLGAFALAEQRASAPLMPLPVLGRHGLALATVALTAAAMATAFFLLALQLQQLRGLSPLETSAVFLLPTPAIVAAGPVAGRFIPRLGARRVLAIGLLVAAAGLLLLASLLGLPHAGLLVFPFGAGLAFSGATVATAQAASPDRLGLIGGLVNTAMEVGPPLGLAVLAGLVSASSPETSMGDARALRVAAAGLVLTALFALRPNAAKHQEEQA